MNWSVVVFFLSRRAATPMEPSRCCRNKESIHLKVVVAQQVEGGIVATLEGVAEQLSF